MGRMSAFRSITSAFTEGVKKGIQNTPKALLGSAVAGKKSSGMNFGSIANYATNDEMLNIQKPQGNFLTNEQRQRGRNILGISTPTSRPNSRVSSSTASTPNVNSLPGTPLPSFKTPAALYLPKSAPIVKPVILQVPIAVRPPLATKKFEKQMQGGKKKTMKKGKGKRSFTRKSK